MLNHSLQLPRPDRSAPIPLRLEEAAVQYELPTPKDVIRYVVGSFERMVVVRDVVPGRHGQQDQVGRILPDLMLQREQLLARAIASFGEVQNLDRSATQGREAALDELADRLLERDLEGFDVGVAQQGNPERTWGVVQRYLWS